MSQSIPLTTNDFDKRVNSECQCSLGREKLLSAPLDVGTRTVEEERQYTAPTFRTPHQVKCLTNLTLLTFRAPLNYDQSFCKVFPSATPLRIVKRTLAKLLDINPNNLLLTKNREILQEHIHLMDIKSDAMGFVNLDVFTKDNSAISFSGISKEAVIEDLSNEKKYPKMITIKFRIKIQKETITKSFPARVKIFDVRNNLACLFQNDPYNLDFLRNGKTLKDNVILKNLDFDDFGIVEIDLRTVNNEKLDLSHLYRIYEPQNDILTINVPFGDTVKPINIEIIYDPIRKPYLGGYMNVMNGTEYHHAFSQTPQKPERVAAEFKNCRSTQTAEEVEKIDDTSYSRPTQMSFEGIYIPCLNDRIVVPKPYETYEEMVARLRHNYYASVIQRAYRSYIFRKMVRAWLDECMEIIRRTREEEMERRRHEDRLKLDLVTKTFPRTREDFDQLYAMVDRWKASELARISALHSKGPRIAEMNILLDKEVELLRCIESYRVKVKEDKKKLKQKSFLEELCKPVTWYGYKQKVICMDTIEVQRARNMKQMYEAYLNYNVNIEARLELLVNIKLVLKDYYHPLPDDTTTLIDRECDLMVRNCSSYELEILRKRIAGALFRFIETTQLNQRVTFNKNTQDYRDMQNNRLYVCEMCNKCKSYKEFNIFSRVSKMVVCKSCSWKNVTSLGWVDMTPFKFILRAVQRCERRKKCWGSVAFVLQEKDVHFLVERIWHSHSAISECNDITELRLCRWYKERDWAPWNCFLVTVMEMKAHLKLEDPESVYDEELVNKVKNKHLLAKGHFEQLIQVNQEYTGAGRWQAVRATAIDRVNQNGVPPI